MIVLGLIHLLTVICGSFTLGKLSGEILWVGVGYSPVFSAGECSPQRDVSGGIFREGVFSVGGYFLHCSTVLYPVNAFCTPYPSVSKGTPLILT